MVPRGRRKERERGKRGITIGRRVGKIGFMGRGISAPSRETPDVVHALGLRIDEDLVTDSDRERERCRYDAVPKSGLLRTMFSRKPAAVVFPNSGQCVADILDVCIEERTPAVPRGLGSAGLGGAVPVRGGVVIDLSRMKNVVAIDRECDTVTVEAGCTWENLKAAVASEGLGLRSYPAGRAAGTVGGWVSTGGYGVGTLAEGRFDTGLEALEAAAPSGILVNAGRGGGRYSIESFAGTEGQLGIITGVTFALKRRPERQAHYAVGPVGVEAGVSALCDLAVLDDPPLGLKLLSGDFPALADGMGLTAGRDSVLAILVEGSESGVKGFDERLKRTATGLGADLTAGDAAGKVFDARLAGEGDRQAKTVVRSGEVLVGLDRLAGFIGSLRREFGHRLLVDTLVVDRELALVMVFYLEDRDEMPPVVRDVPLTVRVSLEALRVGGRPYGIGIWNSPFSGGILGKELKHLETIKRDTDRLRILNPGKFFGLTTWSGLPVWGWTYRTGLRLMGAFGEGGVK